MTEKEAIEHIKKRICCEQPVAHHCRDNCLYGESECAFGLAIKALEKQIPKKPRGDLHCVPHFRCPSCTSSVRTYVNSTKIPYCAWCGQKIDWGEE